MRLVEEQERFLIRHYSPVIGVLMIIGASLVAIPSRKAFINDPGDVSGNLLSLLLAGLVATLAAVAARQFERNLQQGRMREAFQVLTSADDIADDTSKQRRLRAGLIMLDDLPWSLLYEKNDRIAKLLVEIGITRNDVLEIDSIKDGPLSRALVGTAAEESHNQTLKQTK